MLKKNSQGFPRAFNLNDMRKIFICLERINTIQRGGKNTILQFNMFRKKIKAPSV